MLEPTDLSKKLASQGEWFSTKDIPVLVTRELTLCLPSLLQASRLLSEVTRRREGGIQGQVRDLVERLMNWRMTRIE